MQFADQCCGGAIQENIAAAIDRIACEIECIGISHRNPVFGRHARRDPCLGSGIESCWVIHEIASLKRAEAGIEMIKTFINQPQRLNVDVEPIGQKRRTRPVRAMPVTQP